MIRISIRTITVLLSAVMYQAALGADTYQERLNQVLAEYRTLPVTRDVTRLVELDRELKAMVKEIQETHKDGTSKQYWRKDYENIGLYLGHYSDALGYSGKLLVEAHKRNPNSPYRKYTLYTTILGEGTFHGFGEMPNIGQAELYLKEFPNGPYAENVYAILGYFYDDLAKVLKRFVENEKNKEDYKYNCFAPYITKAPYQEQMHRAITLAVSNLEKAIAATFERRHTALPVGIPIGLNDEFARDASKRTQWKAFLGKNRLDAPALDEVIAEIRRFATEPLKLARQQKGTP
jgi:hypothetical protein